MATKPIDVVVEFMKEQEWAYDLDEEGQRVFSGFEGGDGVEFPFNVWAGEDRKVCYVLSVLPMKCPKARRRHCAELLSRLNYGMLVGCFEMDYDSGRIHFKSSAPFTNSGLDREVFESLLAYNLSTMARSLPGIMSVAYGRVSPKRAEARIEAAANAKERAKPLRPGHHRYNRN